MDYYVKEQPDKSAILMAINGYELAVYPSVNIAITACCQDCLVRPLFVKPHYNLAGGPDDYDSSFI